MKRSLRTALLCLVAVALLQAGAMATDFSARLKTTTGGAPHNFLRLTLKNCAGYIPHVSGVGVLGGTPNANGETYWDILPNPTTGLIAINVQDEAPIHCGVSGAVAYYNVAIYQGDPVGPRRPTLLSANDYDITGTTFDLATATPKAVTSIPAPSLSVQPGTVGQCPVYVGTGSPSTTLGPSDCTSGGGGSITIQTAGTDNASQTAINFVSSATNSAGFAVTPANPSGSAEKFEVTVISASTARAALGLGSAATQDSSAFDAAGAATAETTRATAAEATKQAKITANNIPFCDTSGTCVAGTAAQVVALIGSTAVQNATSATNASTATAAAVAGTECGAGQAARGVDASWNARDCFTPAGSGTVNSGTSGQIAYYGTTGTGVSGTNALPNGTTATTQSAGDNSTKVGTTGYTDAAVTAETILMPLALIPAAGISKTGWTAYHAYGDSITGGSGVSNPGVNDYVSLVGAWAGLSSGAITNRAVGGDMACDMAAHAVNYDSPTTNDNVLRTVMIGINDSGVHGGTGAYEDTYNLCDNAALTWLMVPASQKVLGGSFSGGLPTNWGLDTAYSAATGLTTTTQNATSTWTLTQSGLTGVPVLMIWYRMWDLGSGATGSTFSYQVNGGTIYYVNSWPQAPMSTWNGRTDSIGVATLYLNGGQTSPFSVVIKQYSASGTTSIIGVGLGPNVSPTMTANPLWVSGVSRGTNQFDGEQSTQYNRDQTANVLNWQHYGFPINFVNVRNFWHNNLGDMQGVSSAHPNDLGATEIANAFESAIALPEVSPPQINDPSRTPARVISSATNCTLANTDNLVEFWFGASGSCQLPVPNYATPFAQQYAKIIRLTNSSNGKVTLTLPQSVSFSGNPIIETGQSITIASVPLTGASSWQVISTSDPTLLSTCINWPGLPYTVPANAECVVLLGTGTITFSSDLLNSNGKIVLLMNQGSGVITFTNGNLPAGYSIQPGNSGILFGFKGDGVSAFPLQSLPTATASVLGGVKPDGTSILNSAGAISVTAASVGLGGVTNDAQTKAAVMPNTAPAAGQVPCGNAGGTAYAPCTVGADAALSSSGALTLATVNSNIGSCGDATHVGQATFDGKGRATACSAVAITFPPRAYPIPADWNGVPPTAQVLHTFIIPTYSTTALTITVPASCAGSAFTVWGTAGTGSTVFSLKKNGTAICTATISASCTGISCATWAGSGGTLTSLDVATISGGGDATLGGVSMTIAATATGGI